MTIFPAGVVFVEDVAKVASFYECVAGLTILHSDPSHAVLQGSGFQLTVHALPPSDHQATGACPPRLDSYIKLCFPVESIERARSVATRFGGEVWPPEKEWTARGFRACDGRDPEGNIFQLRQSAPEVQAPR